MKELVQELKDLAKALGNNTVTVTEYCDAYYAISQKINQLNK